MGTNNFAQVSTKVIHVVTTEDEFIWQDTKDNVVSGLDGLGFYKDDTLDTDDNRSYPSTSIGGFDLSGNGYYINIVCKTVSGYYSDFTLDYQYNIILDYETESVDEITEILSELTTHLSDTLESIEKVYSQYSDQLVKVGQFSNGEALYETAEPSV